MAPSINLRGHYSYMPCNTVKAGQPYISGFSGLESRRFGGFTAGRLLYSL